MELHRRVLGFFCVFFMVMALGGAVARGEASGGDPVQKVTALNKKALDAYAKGDFDTARDLLTEALELCNTAGLATHPIKARTHIHLGIVSIVGFNKRPLGIKHFRKALEIQPEIKLTKSLATPELQAAFDEASGGGGGGDAEGGGAPPQANAGDDTGGGAPNAANDTDNAGGGGSAPPAADSGDEDSTPRIRRAPPKKKKKPVDEEEGDDDEGAESPYHIYIALSLGTGAGIASGSGELNPAHTLAAAGFAPAQLGFIAPEVGFFPTSSLLLSARLRVQYVSGLTGEPAKGSECGSDNFCTPTPWGIAAFARATYFLMPPGGFRFFLAGELGGGNIRHAETFPKDTNCGMTGAKTQCVDSLKSGPFLFGPAVGFLWDFGPSAGLLVSLATDIGVPNFTANFDANVGVAVHF